MRNSRINKSALIVIAFLVLAAGAWTFFYRASLFVGLSSHVNNFRALDLPAGTLVLERAAETAPPLRHSPVATTAAADWPSFNRSLTSERFAPLALINRENVRRLRVRCIYDSGDITSFEAGPLVIGDMMVATTENDIFAIDPETCKQIWRTHEDYKGVNPLRVNRGAAYLDGRLFRGTQDGRVLAYDARSGQRLWERFIGDPAIGETTPAAPIAWNGLVFIGTAGGDYKGIKGRMYALDAQTGEIRWEFFLVPRAPGEKIHSPLGKSPLDGSTRSNSVSIPVSGGGTWTSFSLDPETRRLYVPGGNPGPDFAVRPRGGDDLYTGSLVVLDAITGDYIHHYQLVPKDFHDWDVSGAPTLAHTQSGRSIVAIAPKNGMLYSFDRATNQLLFETRINRAINVDVPLAVGDAVRFCPGTAGGAEWNGPAYDPVNDLIYVGEVDWCTTVEVDDEETLRSAPIVAPWFGHRTKNPFDIAGKFDDPLNWGGWLYAVDAETGKWRWRDRSNYPVQSGVTPTAGGVVFFGDMGGNFYALDADSGERLWGQKIGGAIGGGVVTYTTHGIQRVAVAVGFTSVIWPTERTTGKIVVLGID